MRLFGRVGEARVAGPGAARASGRVWAAGWVAGGEGQGRGLRGGGCCVSVCVRLQRCACVVSCRPGGLEEKLAVFLRLRQGFRRRACVFGAPLGQWWEEGTLALG